MPIAISGYITQLKVFEKNVWLLFFKTKYGVVKQLLQKKKRVKFNATNLIFISLRNIKLLNYFQSM